MIREYTIKKMQKYFKDSPDVEIFWCNNEELFEVHTIPIKVLIFNFFSI